MIVNGFALLASDTARTKAYLQAMICENKLPEVCIVYSDYILKMQKEAKQYKKRKEENEYFDVEQPIFFSLDEAEIPYVLVDSKDINSGQMENILRGLEQKYLIYSGYGGYILKPHLFRLDKRFIHIHAGILPQYRGSTTVYYSLLQERTLGATAIFLNEGIDEGEIIAQEIFDIPEKVSDLDYIYEPYMRSRVLIKVLNQYLKNGVLRSYNQEQKGAETYFIIHPVLKHLAMLGIEQKSKQQ